MPPDLEPHIVWRTKPTDRFILRWIKVHLSARITPGLGMLAGLVYGLGAPWLAGCLAAAAQVFDGVDGQYARLTGR